MGGGGGNFNDCGHGERDVLFAYCLLLPPSLYPGPTPVIPRLSLPSPPGSVCLVDVQNTVVKSVVQMVACNLSVVKRLSAFRRVHYFFTESLPIL